jgi:hypothetical protein
LGHPYNADAALSRAEKGLFKHMRYASGTHEIAISLWGLALCAEALLSGPVKYAYMAAELVARVTGQLTYALRTSHSRRGTL